MAGRAVSVGIVGATGAVGRAILQALEDSDLEIEVLRLLASERGAGAELDFRGQIRTVDPLAEGAFAELDLAFFAATADVSRAWAERAVAAGCAVVDLTPAFRADPAVPLVVPELDASALAARPRRIVAVPGASAVQLALALAPLHAAAGLEHVVVTSCEAVSGAGQGGIEELEAQTRAMLGFQEPPAPSTIPHRIAFNLVPQIGRAADGDRTDAERSLASEVARLLGVGAPGISATCVRVPLFYGHLQIVHLRTARPLGAAGARAALRNAPALKVIDVIGEGVYPMPMLSVNDEAVLVGRIRDDPSQERALDLVIASDNLRRGAATTAVAVAKLLLEPGVTTH